MFQCQHGQHRRVTSRPDRHGVARRDAVGPTHQPVAFDTGLFGIGAEMGLTEPPAVTDHMVARFPARMGGLLDSAGEIDARDHWKTPDHRRLAGDGETILVVQRRPLDANGDVAFHQIGFVELDEGRGRTLLRLVDPDCFEHGHRTVSRRLFLLTAQARRKFSADKRAPRS